MNGTFCISIDTELLWGRKDLDYSKFIERTKKERDIIKKLLSLFSKYNINTTWAIVGKLYEKGDEFWCGKDIVEMIKKKRIHELASHSYSHEDFTKISRKKAKQEFKKPRAFSFIFPRNHIAYLDLLKKSGFKAYRGPDETNTTKHIIQLINLLLNIPPRTSNPIKDKGLINIPGSMYFVSARGVRKYIPYGLRLRRAKSGIDKAISKGQIFHLWFHPVDFADNEKSLFREFENILKYAKSKRDKNLLEIKTMSQIARGFSK
ncbi:MAG: polysaccharide deacetylase family protein [Candidatus Woesebacteria bacterium]|nr:MAG: polysaccharide deacetylase family protein [Candidatus Woesebacteria bacterium]